MLSATVLVQANVNMREKISRRANVGLFRANIGRITTMAPELLHKASHFYDIPNRWAMMPQDASDKSKPFDL